MATEMLYIESENVVSLHSKTFLKGIRKCLFYSNPNAQNQNPRAYYESSDLHPIRGSGGHK